MLKMGIQSVDILSSNSKEGDMVFNNHELYYSWAGSWVKVITHPPFRSFHSNLKRIKNKINH